ncbi:MAG: metal-sensitive transcriptional regulator [Cyanobacteria bacterium J06629_19]
MKPYSSSRHSHASHSPQETPNSTLDEAKEKTQENAQENIKNDSGKSVSNGTERHSSDTPAAHVHPESLHAHVHSEESLRKLVNRISRLEGHIRGIKTMVQENRPCPDVLIQVAAVRGGLDKVARLILDEHLNECITRAVDEGNIAAEVDALKAALDRFIA